MRSLPLAIVSIMAVFMVPDVAHAQLSPGASGTSSAPVRGNENDYWYLIRQMGDCLADSKADQSAAMLAATPGSEAETQAVGKLFNRSYNNCMKTFVSASFVRAHLRGSLAESLYRTRRQKMADAFVPRFAEPDVVNSLHDFAACYVALEFDSASSLLEGSRLATDAERNLVRDMASGFGPCLPEGTEIEIKPIDIRLAIAEAMYRTTLPAEGQS